VFFIAVHFQFRGQTTMLSRMSKRSSISTTRYFLLAAFSLLLHRGAEAQTDTSSRIVAAPKDVLHVEALSDLNMKGDNASCFIGSDGSIYYASTAGGKFELYSAKRQPSEGLDRSSHWSQPTKYFELPGKQNVNSLAVAADGRTAVVGICNRPDGIFQTCDLYSAEIVNGKVENIEHLADGINTEWWDAQPTISRDGNTMYFASDRKHGKGGSDIYMCSRGSDGKWGAPVNLSFNTGGNEISPFISADDKTLYFASDHMAGGMGGFDIYMTRRTGENEWTEPKNMGPSVNSKYDEMFFYVPPTGDELYVTSDREGAYKLFRIFVQPPPPKPKFAVLTGRLMDAETHQQITRQPEITITVNGQKVQNEASGPMYSVRVPAGALVHVDAGADAYVSTVVDWNAPNEKDRSYSSETDPTVTQDISLAPSHARLIGHVSNAISHRPLQAKVMLERLAGDMPPVTVMSDERTGAYTFNVNPLITYKISAVAENFEPYPTSLDPVKVEIPAAREKMITVEKEILMTPSNIEHVLLFFDFNKYDLKPEEEPKLAKFIEQVKINPSVRIEANGYTDSVGTQEKNLVLSTKRAKTVVDYLISQGVPKDQVVAVQGFGKSAPLDPADPAKNRRVEVRIVGKQD
jgi:outer membrane protein OmpA-like peptidoglycan-associated protein